MFNVQLLKLQGGKYKAQERNEIAVMVSKVGT
jgi:hypothetical protein